MKLVRKSPRRWLIFATFGVLLLLTAPLGYRWYAVAQLQHSLERNWEVHFGSIDPPGLAGMVDLPAYKLISWATKGRNDNWGDVLQERVVSLFRGTIREIVIYDPHAFRGDVGAALLRFPKLKSLILHEDDETLPTEAEYTLLCTRLRQLAELERLNLGGGQLTTAALAPLAGHPKLRVLELSYSRITPNVADMLSTLPNLEEINIGQVWNDPAGWAAPARQAEFRARLPGVKILF